MSPKNKIYLSPPHMGSMECDLLMEAFDSNWIAPLGPHVDNFEDEIAKYIGIDHAAALSSGTAALHLALKVLVIKPGDKVLCSSLTFAASANAIMYENCFPVFIDSDPSTWNLNVNLIERAIIRHNPRALIAVDLYGQSCDYGTISQICKKHNVAVIEDSAEALGAEYKGQKCGAFGDISAFSFNGNKIITTSSGGMFLSDNEEYVEKARFLATQAREPEIHYEHKELGNNYRMSNLLAAVGRGQLQVLDQRVDARRAIFTRYYHALAQIEGIDFMPEADYGKSNRWLTTLTINPQITGIDRTQIIQALEKENIEARPVWKPMHLQPLYKDCEYITKDRRDISRELFVKGLCLPSGSSLGELDQDRVIDIILSNLST
ncbi:MAG: DegT/DnrJ/EryC1/StrS family aminotransferase [Mariniphaga sp.]|nr:DegT/DnrJ/EryC1/StrS family aminotransferase [Mariniphaga sp.]